MILDPLADTLVYSVNLATLSFFCVVFALIAF